MVKIYCAFCEIPDIKKRAVLKNDLAFAFLTNIPIVPGHMLISPFRCVKTFDEMTPEEVQAIFDVRNKLSEVLKKLFGAEGFNYAWNEGKAGGQEVPHFHLHMLPRKTGDTGITGYDPRKFLYRPGRRETSPEAELQEIAATIRKELG